MANLTNIEKALLDTIAYSEGTLGVSKNGYDVVVNYKIIDGWTENTKIIHGDQDWLQQVSPTVASTAAGRYQFLGSTWKGMSIHKGVNVPMTKNNQDTAAIHLINYRLKHEITNKPLTIPEITDKEKFTLFIDKCKNEWTSFKVISNNVLWDVFKTALNCYKTNCHG